MSFLKILSEFNVKPVCDLLDLDLLCLSRAVKMNGISYYIRYSEPLKTFSLIGSLLFLMVFVTQTAVSAFLTHQSHSTGTQIEYLTLHKHRKSIG